MPQRPPERRKNRKPRAAQAEQLAGTLNEMLSSLPSQPPIPEPLYTARGALSSTRPVTEQEVGSRSEGTGGKAQSAAIAALLTPNNLRSAFILTEILSPPKALREE